MSGLPSLPCRAITTKGGCGEFPGRPMDPWMGPGSRSSWPAGRIRDSLRGHSVDAARDRAWQVVPLAMTSLGRRLNRNPALRAQWLCNPGSRHRRTDLLRVLRGRKPGRRGCPAWRNGGVLFITWDEAAGADIRGCCGLARGGGHVLTLVFAPGLPAGERVALPYDHYSLLATVADGLGLPLLGHAADPGSQPLAAFWTRARGSGAG